MLRHTYCFAALATAALVTACNPYDPDLGQRPFQCGNDEPKCPEGYTCSMDDVCVQSAGGDTVDARSNAFTCAEDGAEGRPGNNDARERAFVTPVPNMQTYQLAGLAICPTEDKDYFKFSIDQNGQDFEATVSSVAGRTPLSLRVLNSAGVMVTSGTQRTPQVVRAELEGLLAIGDYFVEVSSQDMTENNYDLTIKVCNTPMLPCP